MKTLATAVLIFTLIMFTSAAFSQVKRHRDKSERNDHYPTQNLIERRAQKVGSSAYAEIFRAVERGVFEGNVGTFSKYFGFQVYVSLPGGENGYYSANQAYYILQNYFGGRRPQSFRFSTYGESDSVPYATGAGRFEVRGSVETVQVYVSVSNLNKKWVLSQVNIY